ncbi:MAG: PAS domain S-box protein, partial [Alphaproteobacteria bacterium]
MENKTIQIETMSLADSHPYEQQQTNEQLLNCIRSLRARITGLERLEGEHERIEQALINALQEWETTFNATRDSIMLVDKEFQIVQANHAASRFFGKPLGSILGQTAHKLLFETQLPPENYPLLISKQTNKHEEAEFYMPSKDVWILISADPVTDDTGGIGYFVHILRDITYRKKSEETLARLNLDLQKT